MDYSRILFDPIYATFDVSALLTPNRSDAVGITVSVIERTTSSDVSDEFELGTLRPGAFVRRRDLDAVGIFGGHTWRIEAHSPRPGPDGEASGEILMHLAEEPNA